MPAPGPHRPSFDLTVQYAAAPEAVWRAWTDPQALREWFKPSASCAILDLEADVRPGGRIRLVMQEPGGPELEASGVYREVVAGEKLVFTWIWKGQSPEHESLVTVHIRPRGTGTEVELRHERFFDAYERDEHQKGWHGSLALLARSLEPAQRRTR